jgi:hypothetical protein
MKVINFEAVTQLEEKLATFFGAPYAICLDSCTHGIELCLRLKKAKYIECPKHTYLSVPFLANKLNIELRWKDIVWQNYYYVTDDIIDAAVLWRKDSYIPRTFMSISFQYQKHLNLGRGGVILTDNKEAAIQLKKMSYDGRLPNIPWREQNIETFGYHYYMTPETAKLGLDIFEDRVNTEPRQWVMSDWPDLTQMKVFQTENKLTKIENE